MQIIIKPYDAGVEFALEVQPTDNILSIKVKIEARENIVPDSQRLLFQGKHLVDDDTLESRGIQDGSTIHLIKK